MYVTPCHSPIRLVYSPGHRRSRSSFLIITTWQQQFFYRPLVIIAGEGGYSGLPRSTALAEVTSPPPALLAAPPPFNRVPCNTRALRPHSAQCLRHSPALRIPPHTPSHARLSLSLILSSFISIFFFPHFHFVVSTSNPSTFFRFDKFFLSFLVRPTPPRYAAWRPLLTL